MGTIARAAKNRWVLTAVATGCSAARDRKSTRLNSSHLGISYAVFCLKKQILALCLLRLRAGAGRAALLLAAAAFTLAIFSHYLALPLALLLIALVPLAGRLAAPPAPPAQRAAARRHRRAGAEAADLADGGAAPCSLLAWPALTRADWLLAAAVAGGLTLLISLLVFFLSIRRPPRSTLFPYTTLFR